MSIGLHRARVGDANTDYSVICMDPGWVKTRMGGDGAILEPHVSISGMLSTIHKAQKNGETAKFYTVSASSSVSICAFTDTATVQRQRDPLVSVRSRCRRAGHTLAFPSVTVNNAVPSAKWCLMGRDRSELVKYYSTSHDVIDHHEVSVHHQLKSIHCLLFHLVNTARTRLTT